MEKHHLGSPFDTYRRAELIQGCGLSQASFHIPPQLVIQLVPSITPFSGEALGHIIFFPALSITDIF